MGHFTISKAVALQNCDPACLKSTFSNGVPSGCRLRMYPRKLSLMIPILLNASSRAEAWRVTIFFNFNPLKVLKNISWELAAFLASFVGSDRLTWVGPISSFLFPFPLRNELRSRILQECLKRFDTYLGKQWLNTCSSRGISTQRRSFPLLAFFHPMANPVYLIV